MKSDYDKIIELINDERITSGLKLNEDLGKKFVLGQTRFVWRHGTLSDGHEKITPSQRYYQANKEIYMLSRALESYKFRAMESRADLMDAEKESRRFFKSKSEKMRIAARIGRARADLTDALDNAQEAMRGIDELSLVVKDLESGVMAQYPNGIEQAEHDNWKAVFEYRMTKERVQGSSRERVDNIPMDPVTKATLGYYAGRVDAIAPLLILDPLKCEQIAKTFEQDIIAQQKLIPLKTLEKE